MFAVIKTGGKQYRVSPDDVLKIEKIEGDEGSRVEFGQVLMVGEGTDVTIGAPAVDGARVTAEVVEQGRGAKTISFKKRRRQNSRRKKGHRQYLTTVAILEILKDGAKPKRDASGKSAEDRRAEAAAAYAGTMQVEGVAVQGAAESDDAPKAAKKTTAKKGGAKGASEGEAKGDADDAGLIEGSADAKPAESKKAAPKKAEAKKAAKSAPSEDDEAADREAEMAEEAKAAKKKAGSTEKADAPADAPEGPLFEAPEGEPDKLTKIKGIGPVAEKQLNEQGITTYAQIAALTDEDVERIDAYMPFSAAQIRTWREQAAELK